MVNRKKLLRQAKMQRRHRINTPEASCIVYENNTKGEYFLPRPTAEGIRSVAKGRQFIGDSYYMQFVSLHELRFIKRIDEVDVNKLYVYQNIANEEIKLPFPNESGQTHVAANASFVGDQRFFSLLKEGKAKLLSEVAMTEKLITEQPPTVTHNGQVEYVKQADIIVEKEVEDEKKKKKDMINENPMDGVKLLFD